MNDLRILRDRFAAADDAFDLAQAGGEAYGSAAMLVITTSQGSYPTTAQATYACNPVSVDGVEAEGQAASYVTDTSTLIFANNIGTAIPDQGTKVLVDGVGGRWTFRYD